MFRKSLEGGGGLRPKTALCGLGGWQFMVRRTNCGFGGKLLSKAALCGLGGGGTQFFMRVRGIFVFLYSANRFFWALKRLKIWHKESPSRRLALARRFAKGAVTK